MVHQCSCVCHRTVSQPNLLRRLSFLLHFGECCIQSCLSLINGYSCFLIDWHHERAHLLVGSGRVIALALFFPLLYCGKQFCKGQRAAQRLRQAKEERVSRLVELEDNLGDKMLQDVRGYKMLQDVTRCCKTLQAGGAGRQLTLQDVRGL